MIVKPFRLSSKNFWREAPKNETVNGLFIQAFQAWVQEDFRLPQTSSAVSDSKAFQA
jgi:hypothetical protein